MIRLDRPEFIEQLVDEVPPRPLNMSAIEATNRGAADMSWAMLSESPAIPEMAPNEIETAVAGALLLDVREPSEYAYSHVPGAINMPQADLASRLDELPHDRNIVVICQAGMRALRSAQFLRQVGFERVASLKGGIAEWHAAGRPLTHGGTDATEPRIVETGWGHAGGYNFEI